MTQKKKTKVVHDHVHDQDHDDSVVMRHIESVNKCYEACKETVQEMQTKKAREIQNVVMRHVFSLQKVGGMGLMKAFMQHDFVHGMQALNIMLENKKVVDIIVSMLKDVCEIYRNSKSDINAIVACYLSKCDDEAIKITRESIRLFGNIMRIVCDKKVQSQVAVLRTLFKENIAYALSLLDRKQPTSL